MSVICIKAAAYSFEVYCRKRCKVVNLFQRGDSLVVFQAKQIYGVLETTDLAFKDISLNIH